MGLQLHTRNLTDGQSLVLDGSEGVLMISYQMSSASGDAGTLLGNLSFKASSDPAAVPPQAVSIPAGGGNVFVSDANQKGIVLAIGCTQGTLKLIIGQ